MRKLFGLLLACLVLLAGCGQNTPSANLPPPVGSDAQIEAVSEETPESLPDSTPTAAPYFEMPAPTSIHPDVSIDPSDGEVIEIKEKMFIAQTNDIYFNSEDYLGKTIKYEGIFDYYLEP